MRRNTYPVLLAAVMASWAAAACVAAADGGRGPRHDLDSGIVLETPWPPRRQPARSAAVPLYLTGPPPVIPIDGGRQLFVDDFLIEETTLHRTHHLAEYHPASPVLVPDKPWETSTESRGFAAPCAMVFSDGVWHDPQDGLFKMWYMGGYLRSTCLAVSKDGVQWQKPVLDVRPGTNIVHDRHRDSATVWLDLEEEDPERRYKLFVVQPVDEGWSGFVHLSADGIHWGEPVARTEPVGDRTTAFRNPFRDVWVYSIRCGIPGIGRARLYREHPDAGAGATWTPAEAPFWIAADDQDSRRPETGVAPELYNLDAVAYESLLLGMFTIWPGQPTDRAKPNYVSLGFSRDGFHWHRPDRRPFIGVSERVGDWNWCNVQSAGGCCLVVGDRLYFYVSGRAGVVGSEASGVCSTGLAVLRRDGFASMDAGEEGGALTTRPIRFSGRRLFVNADAGEGELRVEVLDAEGDMIPPFSLDQCTAACADSTMQEIVWRSGEDLSVLRGRPVRFRFVLRDTRLYSFWVSPDAAGASHGYVGAGGPGFTGSRDTVGTAAYRAAEGLLRK